MGGRLADLPGDRSEHRGLLEVVLRDNEVRLGLKDGGLRLFRGRFGVVALKLRDAALVRLLHSLEVALGSPRFGLGSREVGLALVRDGLVALVIDHVEDLPLLYDVAFLELDLPDVSVDLRKEIDLLHRLGVGDEPLREVVYAQLGVRDGDGLLHRRHRSELRGLRGSRATVALRPHVLPYPAARDAYRREDYSPYYATDR